MCKDVQGAAAPGGPPVVPTLCSSCKEAGGEAQGPTRPPLLCSPRALIRPSPATPGRSDPACAGRSCWWPSVKVTLGPSGPAAGTKVDSGRRDEQAAGAREGRAAQGRPLRPWGSAPAPPAPRPGTGAVRGQLTSGSPREAEQARRRPRPRLSLVPSFRRHLLAQRCASLSLRPAPSGSPHPQPTAPAPGGAGDPLPPSPSAEWQAEWDVPSGGSPAD